MEQENTDANKAADSSTDATESAAQAPTSAETNSAPKPENSNQLPFHEHPRFKELINEKNELKEQLSNMERILQERDNPSRPDPVSQAKQELVSLGMDDKVADKILNAVKLSVLPEVEQRVAPMQQAISKREIDSWIDDFRKSHDDYETLEPQMYEVFKALPPQTRNIVASDKMGVQLLYDHVKQRNADAVIKQAKLDAANEAYKNKQIKASLTTGASGSPGPTGKIEKGYLDSLPLEEYKALRKDKAKWEAVVKALEKQYE